MPRRVGSGWLRSALLERRRHFAERFPTRGCEERLAAISRGDDVAVTGRDLLAVTGDRHRYGWQGLDCDARFVLVGDRLVRAEDIEEA